MLTMYVREALVRALSFCAAVAGFRFGVEIGLRLVDLISFSSESSSVDDQRLVLVGFGGRAGVIWTGNS